MKNQISSFQFSLIIGNFIFSGTIVSVQQIVIEVAKQNAWIVILISYLIIIGIVYFISANKAKLEKLRGLYDTGNSNKFHKVFVFILLLFLFIVFIRDFRAVNGFIDIVLLPDTPIDVIALLMILSLIYISLAGIEVIARITVIHFFVIATIFVACPLLLINEINFKNIQPIGGVHALADILKAVYLITPWMGEALILVFLMMFINPIEKIRISSIFGTTLGILGVFISTILLLTVLGVGVASEATHPNIELIQQINLTDFLDRLDLIIVTVWLPAMFCKLALLVFGIQKSLNILRGSDDDKGLLPLGLILGLTTQLFSSNIDHLEFAFFTWATLGMTLEVLIILLFILIKNKHSGLGKTAKKNSKIHPSLE